MTWHPLATNPLPEPNGSARLIVDVGSSRWVWLAHGAHWHCAEWCVGTEAQLREWILDDYPNAQWHLVPAPGEPSETDELRKRVAELEDLVSRAIRCSHRVTSLKVPRWTCVKRVFSVGSTRAHELCRSYGLDPDETVGGKSWPKL